MSGIVICAVVDRLSFSVSGIFAVSCVRTVLVDLLGTVIRHTRRRTPRRDIGLLLLDVDGISSHSYVSSSGFSEDWRRPWPNIGGPVTKFQERKRQMSRIPESGFSARNFRGGQGFLSQFMRVLGNMGNFETGFLEG